MSWRSGTDLPSKEFRTPYIHPAFELCHNSFNGRIAEINSSAFEQCMFFENSIRFVLYILTSVLNSIAQYGDIRKTTSPHYPKRVLRF